jgi:saccharopine dehydrogenase-like NADP-dependent oxidoreductase
MKKILLFGAGKSSSALIQYLLRNAVREGWQLTVADANLQAAREKLGDSVYGHAVALDILQEEGRSRLIRQADLVISLLPSALHILVAKDCLFHKRNLLTASYVDESIRQLAKEIESSGLLFLCEMGLDPGIDHMSAKKLIDEIQLAGGNIKSFVSHCGGLVAPESDDNPWHYKISWNPRNVVMAGKAGAVFRESGEKKELDYKSLFEEKRYVQIPGDNLLCWYPNRDSLDYLPIYGLEDVSTFIRTTLRHPDFIYGWKNLINLNLTSESQRYNTNGKTLQQFFKEHMDKNGFGDWLQQTLSGHLDATKKLLSDLLHLTNLEEEAGKKGVGHLDEFMLVNEKGNLQRVDIDQLKLDAAATLADKMHNAKLTLKQLFYLGMDDDKTEINRGECTAADVLQFALEQKLMLLPSDKDRVVMLHEIEFENAGAAYRTTSSLVLNGNDGVQTAMAKTVGLPLGIAAKLILNGTLTIKGLLIPVTAEIYKPVLHELEAEGISFHEETVSIG